MQLLFCMMFIIHEAVPPLASTHFSLWQDNNAQWLQNCFTGVGLAEFLSGSAVWDGVWDVIVVCETVGACLRLPCSRQASLQRTVNS